MKNTFVTYCLLTAWILMSSLTVFSSISFRGELAGNLEAATFDAVKLNTEHASHSGSFTSESRRMNPDILLFEIPETEEEEEVSSHKTLLLSALHKLQQTVYFSFLSKNERTALHQSNQIVCATPLFIRIAVFRL